MKGLKTYVSVALSLMMVAWSLYYVVSVIETYTFRMVHLIFILVLTPLLYPLRGKGSGSLKVVDVILAALGAISILYVFTDFEGFIYRSTMPLLTDVVFGVIVIALILEMMRRTAGWILPALILFLLFYTYAGAYMPPPFTHRGYGLDRIVGHMFMTLEGIFGIPLDVSASFITIFIVYGVMMDAAGAGRFFMDLALSLTGRGPSSGGRVTVLTTGLVGGPQGSGVATTMSLGPLLWPLLREAGYDPDRAAGLLAAGGIGAVISPPIMGAAAFLMMEFLHISYLEVILIVTLPTLLYYASLFFMVELEARKLNFKPITGRRVPTKRALLRGGYHLLSLFILIALIALGRTPNYAALWAIITVLITSYLSRNRDEWLTPKRLIHAIFEGVKGLLPVATVLAGAGIIIGSFTLTGLGLKIAGMIMSASLGIRPIALILAAIAALIIGLGVPITASYVITVIIVAPALVALGVPNYAIHAFVFYYAILSEVSPPVGLSPLAAASITGGNPFKAMMQAWKYTLPTFLIPFLFTLHNEGASILLIKASIETLLPSLFIAVVSLLSISLALMGYLRGRLTLIERVALALGAIGLMVSHPSVNALAVGSLAVILAASFISILRGSKLLQVRILR
ncbi:MAG: TRAP transporter fused permease subunit [Candidatus Nezhaarchaeales archaeon]